jgi:hypothetical protein
MSSGRELDTSRITLPRRRLGEPLDAFRQIVKIALAVFNDFLMG